MEKQVKVKRWIYKKIRLKETVIYFIKKINKYKENNITFYIENIFLLNYKFQFYFSDLSKDT